MSNNIVASVSETCFKPGKAAPAASAAATPARTKPPPVDAAQLKEAIAAANESMGMQSTSIEFSIDPQHGTTIVKVVDKTTGQLIRQMPSEEMVALAKALDHLKGMLISRKA